MQNFSRTIVDKMGIFSRTTSSERDHNTVIELEKQVKELQRELDGAQRRIDAVDLHARAIVEEAKRLINKFERRLDRETPSAAAESPHDAPRSTILRQVGTDRPYLQTGDPKRRGNY